MSFCLNDHVLCSRHTNLHVEKGISASTGTTSRTATLMMERLVCSKFYNLPGFCCCVYTLQATLAGNQPVSSPLICNRIAKLAQKVSEPKPATASSEQSQTLEPVHVHLSRCWPICLPTLQTVSSVCDEFIVPQLTLHQITTKTFTHMKYKHICKFQF